MLTAAVSRVKRIFQTLSAWIKLPFTRGGRQLLSWLHSSQVFETARATQSLPQLCWAQDGEDLLFAELFPASGFYVDIGAHHPDRYSVTKLLYERGWNGLNVDASPGFKQLFDIRRPRDTNIESLVGSPRTEVFYEFSESALSTLNGARASQLQKLGWKLKSQRNVEVRDLNVLLQENMLRFTRIDLLSIDVEGEELNLLSTLDWDRWDVQKCLIEIVEPAYFIPEHPVAQQLLSRGFKLTRVWARSCLFERNFQSDELDRSLS
jgi:FkbM family methyltransferase